MKLLNWLEDILDQTYILNRFKVFLKIYLLPLYVCVHEFMCTAYVQKPMETT